MARGGLKWAPAFCSASHRLLLYLFRRAGAEDNGTPFHGTDMTAEMTRDQIADQIAAEIGHSFDGEIIAGGHYVPLVRDGRTIHLSGQVPRVGTTVVVTGRVGDAVSLDKAREGAQICALRSLALLRRALGSLDAVEKVLRVGVFVQCTADFTQQSEVADAASDLLQSILGASGVHTRTSVGVFQLPKNATVELDLIAIASEPH